MTAHHVDPGTMPQQAPASSTAPVIDGAENMRPDVPRWLNGPEDFGVHVNRESGAEMMDEYARCGFLYPAKQARLEPVMPEVLRTWETTLRAPRAPFLHHCMSHGDRAGENWASVSTWRSLPSRVHSQHLVSHGYPLSSRQVLVAGQCALHHLGVQCVENWFRAENRYPNRIFGSVPERLGAEHTSLERRSLLQVDRSRKHEVPLNVHRARSIDGPELRQWLSNAVNPVAAAAEGLDDGDIELNTLDDAYKQVGLRRYRRVFVATESGTGNILGVSSAYRGPLGLNFSFLENRCDLWVFPGLDPAVESDVATSLIHAAADVYRDYPLPDFTVTCDDAIATRLAALGVGQLSQVYRRCVWLRPAFWNWSCHVASFYSRLLERVEDASSRRSDRRVASGIDRA